MTKTAETVLQSQLFYNAIKGKYEYKTKTAETVLQWHYTKDELPIAMGGEWFFVAVKYQGGYKEITMLEYETDDDGDFLGWYDSENENCSDIVYAWAEIPKPPKEKE